MVLWLTLVLLKDEAAVARERLCSNPANITPQARANPNLRPPYSSNMFLETALHQEVMAIYFAASPQTKFLYDRGIFQDGSNWDNWIIRWCLWHVFRYRDDRNRNRSNRGSYYPVMEPVTEDDSSSDAASNGQYGVYDPVRDIFQ